MNKMYRCAHVHTDKHHVYSIAKSDMTAQYKLFLKISKDIVHMILKLMLPYIMYNNIIASSISEKHSSMQS